MLNIIDNNSAFEIEDINNKTYEQIPYDLTPIFAF